MVESKQANDFDKMVKQKSLMTIIILFPYLNPREVTRFFKLNKTCHSFLAKVNLKVLIEAWGIKLTID